MALALGRIETAAQEAATTDLLDAAYHGARAQVIGLTGPPGVGKSTLIARLIEALRAEDRSVGVIAIDPSSRRSGGALLGDRVRLASMPRTRACSCARWRRAAGSAGSLRRPLPQPC